MKFSVCGLPGVALLLLVLSIICILLSGGVDAESRRRHKYGRNYHGGLFKRKLDLPGDGNLEEQQPIKQVTKSGSGSVEPEKTTTTTATTEATTTATTTTEAPTTTTTEEALDLNEHFTKVKLAGIEDLKEFESSEDRKPASFYSDEEESNIAVPRKPRIEGKSLEEVNIGRGHELKLACNVSGSPTPKVIWVHHDKILKNMDIAKLDETEEITLNLGNIECEATGLYTCAAGNFLGRAFKEFSVHVDNCSPKSKSNPKPKPKPKPRLRQRERNADYNTQSDAKESRTRQRWRVLPPTHYF